MINGWADAQPRAVDIEPCPLYMVIDRDSGLPARVYAILRSPSVRFETQEGDVLNPSVFVTRELAQEMLDCCADKEFYIVKEYKPC